MPKTHPPPPKHASPFGVITLRYRTRTGALTYEQKGGNQSTSDGRGVSLDAHIHAIYGLVLQARARTVLMIGCAGGTLGGMLARAGCDVTVVDIDKVSFRLAKRYFGLPRHVACHAGDGLAFMQKTRRRFDAVVIDVFIGEHIPAHMRGGAFFAAARRCLRKDGAVFVNVCLDRKADATADRIAAGFAASGWPVRVLDSPGAERNAVVMAGRVKGLRRPPLSVPPASGAAVTRAELKAMRFRRRRAVPG